MEELRVKYKTNLSYDNSLFDFNDDGSIQINKINHICDGAYPFDKIGHVGGDKPKQLIEMYENLMNKKKDEFINFLEIGIFRGQSLAVWSDYFKNGIIYGIDGNTKPYYKFKSTLESIGAFKNNNVFVIEADATKENSTEYFLKENVKFDYIIDDGCHATGCIMKTFEIYFKLLKPGGIIFVEDNGEAVIKLREKYPHIKNEGHAFIKNIN